MCKKWCTCGQITHVRFFFQTIVISVMTADSGWTHVDSEPNLLKSIAWALDHPVCRVTSSCTVYTPSLAVATKMAIPIPELCHSKPGSKPLAVILTKWIEDLLLDTKASVDDDAQTLWMRHVEPFLQKCLGSDGELHLAPLLRYSVEPETIFLNGNLLWVKATTCGNPKSIWLVVGARILTNESFIETIVLAVDSPCVDDFARRIVSPSGGRILRL